MNPHVKELNRISDKIINKCPELTFIGNPILRKKTKKTNLKEALLIAEKLKSTLLKYRKITGFGRGLASPQVGENKSVFVTYVDNKFKVYINPKITRRSKSMNFYRETCLSCGYISVDVKRPNSVLIEYTDENGNLQKENCVSFLARLIQHEYDHLDGILNVDKGESGSINFISKDPLKEKLRDF